MPDWTEETKNEIDWFDAISVGWFTGWFVNGWFGTTLIVWEEETKGEIDWIEN